MATQGPERKSVGNHQVLRKGGSCIAWRAWKTSLQIALCNKNLYGYVFDDQPERFPFEKPPAAVTATWPAPGSLRDQQIEASRRWFKNNTIALSIILERLDQSHQARLDPFLMPEDRMTAKQVMDFVQTYFQPPVDIHEAIQSLSTVRLRRNDTQAYCKSFEQRYQKYLIAAEQYVLAYGLDPAEYRLPPGYVKILFEAGTTHCEWLRDWRHWNNASDPNQSLEALISSLRREKPPKDCRPRNLGASAIPSSSNRANRHKDGTF